jgi:hypothetical protein
MGWRRTASGCLLATTVAAAASAGSWDVEPGLTGAPQRGDAAPEATCARCHGGAGPDADADAKIEIQGLPAQYLPGVRYPVALAIVHPDPDRLRWGFALTVVAPGRPGDAGRLIATDRQNTRLLKGEGRHYVVHTYPGTAIGRTGGQRWVFDWVAPLSDVGDIAFFGSLVAADADGTERGDLVYGTASEAIAVTVGPSAARKAAAAATAEPVETADPVEKHEQVEPADPEGR